MELGGDQNFERGRKESLYGEVLFSHICIHRTQLAPKAIVTTSKYFKSCNTTGELNMILSICKESLHGLLLLFSVVSGGFF